MADVPDSVTALAPTMIAPPSAPAAPPPLGPVQAALYAGWTMAVLYGTLQQPVGRPQELPTSRELAPNDRRELELSRLRHLLQQVSYLPELTQAPLPAGIPVDFADENALRQNLATLNLSILTALTAAPPEIQLAYELGRSLRDTVNPSRPNAPGEQSPAVALATQLARDRVAKLQEWLATLSCEFPNHAAAVVATSLGRWSEFAAVTIGATSSRLKKDDARAVAPTLCEHLLPQGDVWLMLLIGARPAAGLLSPEAYVAAGEVALRRSGAIARQVLLRYWAAALIIAAVLGGILYLTISTLSGAAEVWTSIAAIGGCAGVSASTMASTMARLAAEAEQPVFAMAEEDAMAWAITTMPAVDLTSRGVRRLRKAGVAPSSSLGRV